MYSFSHFHARDSIGLLQYPNYATVLEAVKGHPHMRIALDGPAGFERLSPEERHEHRLICQLWEHLRRNHPAEFDRQSKELGRKNAQRLLTLLRLNDPLFAATWRMLEHMLDILPDTAAHLVKKGTHDDAAVFLDLYGEMRDWAEEVEHRKHRRKQAQPRTTANRKPNAPRSRRASRRAERDALIAKVRAGRAEEGDLLKYLELTMPDSDESRSAGDR